MDTIANGNATEAVILSALVARDVPVLLPFGEGQPYDLLAEPAPGRFLRVQCKASRSTGDCIVFNCRATDHGRGRRSYEGLADVFGVYSEVTDHVYLVPVGDLPGFEGRLRFNPARNNQRRGARFASRYEIDRWTTEQLVTIASPARYRGGEGLEARDQNDERARRAG